MPTLEIDGQRVTVEEGLNLIQAAERLGIEIPHYCFHPGLSVAGNCRMCLVEIEKMPKLQIACNTRVADGMVVRTRSERVKAAQGAVLEFLLINHPIDCPVCDQAGECKLQDYYMDYDRQPSRVPLETKVRKQKAIDIGPLVMLDQERCILCSRCTRFLDEVTRTSELGIFQRGDHSRIGLFPGRRLENPYSGNVVDICPVGALTNQDFRFRARVWYLERTSSVCAACASGCNIDVHHRRGEVFRFRPRFNADVNRYWMCDEGRLSYKRHQGEGRLLQPMVRSADRWSTARWDDAIGSVVDRLREISAQHGASAVRGVVSAQATNEEAFLFARFIGEALKGRVTGFAWSPPDAYRDDFLVDADKNPNTSGLRALGIAVEAGDALAKEVEAGGIRALVLLRTDLDASLGDEFAHLLAKRVDYVVVIDTHHRSVAHAADVVLPIAAYTEIDGTFVNRGARVQRIRQAVSSPGQARPGWSLLAELMSRISATDSAAERPASAGDVFARLASSADVFRDLSYDKLGDLGAPLGVSPQS